MSVAAINIADAGTLLLGVAAVITAVGSFVGLVLFHGTRGFSDEAHDLAEAAGSDTETASGARTNVLIDLVAQSERRTQEMRRSIIRCPVAQCPTRVQLLLQEERT